MTFTIRLKNNKKEVVGMAIIDDDDANLIEGHSWHLAKVGYAASRINGKLVLLHRLILGSPESQVDHINRNKLDCRKENLRIVTDAQNKQNVPGRGGTSEVRGVCWDKNQNKWSARFGKHCHRTFKTELDAANFIKDWRSNHLAFSVEN